MKKFAKFRSPQHCETIKTLSHATQIKPLLTDFGQNIMQQLIKLWSMQMRHVKLTILALLSLSLFITALTLAGCQSEPDLAQCHPQTCEFGGM